MTGDPPRDPRHGPRHGPRALVQRRGEARFDDRGATFDAHPEQRGGWHRRQSDADPPAVRDTPASFSGLAMR